MILAAMNKKLYFVFALILPSGIADLWSGFAHDFFKDQMGQDPRCHVLMIGLNYFNGGQDATDSLAPKLVFSKAHSALETIKTMRNPPSCLNVVCEKVEEAVKVDDMLGRMRNKKFLILDRNGNNLKNFSLMSPTRLVERKKRDKFLEFEVCSKMQQPLKLLRNIWIVDESGQFKTQIRHRNVKCPSPFNNLTFKVSAFGLQPYFYFRGSIDTMAGIDIDVVKILADKFGFSIKFSLGRSFGIRNRTTGLWNGVSGEVLYGDSDMGIGNLMATDLDRRQFLDFLESPYHMDVKLFAPSPKPLNFYLNILKPFGLLCWIGILTSLIVVTLILSLVNRPLQGRHNLQEFQTFDNVISPYLVLLREYSRFCDHQNKFFNNSTFILMFLWLLAAFILSLSYSCNLSAYLAKMDFEKAIDNEQDVLDEGRLLFLPASTALFASFRDSPLEIHQTLFKMALENQGQGVFRIKSGWMSEETEEKLIKTRSVMAFPAEPLKLKQHKFGQKNHGENFRIGRKNIISFPCGFLVRKNFPYSEELNKVIGELVSMGLVEGLKRKYYPPQVLVKTKANQNDTVVLDLEHLWGAIFLLLLGFVIAMMAFVSEKWHFACM